MRTEYRTGKAKEKERMVPPSGRRERREVCASGRPDTPANPDPPRKPQPRNLQE